MGRSLAAFNVTVMAVGGRLLVVIDIPFTDLCKIKRRLQVSWIGKEILEWIPS